MLKLTKSTIVIINLFLVLFLILLGLIHYNSSLSYEFVPSTEIDLSELIEKEVWNDEDYEILLQQTGLTKAGLELVDRNDLVKFQQEFLHPYEVRTSNLNSFTVQDVHVDSKGRVKSVENIVPLEAGDIIISITNRSFGVMHGHAAIMVDSKHALFIDNIFSRSRVEDVSCMTRFSNFIIVRSKEDLDFETYFKENLDSLVGHTYDMLASKKRKEFDGGFCSYVTWWPYHELGVDIDSNGGYFVMPKDILASNKLSILQIHGVNREDLLF